MMILNNPIDFITVFHMVYRFPMQGKFIRIHFGPQGKIAGADIEFCESNCSVRMCVRVCGVCVCVCTCACTCVCVSEMDHLCKH